MKNTIIQEIACWLAIAAFMTFMAWATGRAWDYDGDAHSRAAFGNTYECQEDAR